jgi:hypothetical protein
MASVLGVRLLAMAFRITLPIYAERKLERSSDVRSMFLQTSHIRTHKMAR